MAEETEDEAITVALDGAEPEASKSEDAAVADLASQFKELQGNLEREKQARADADRRADEQRRVAEEAKREVVTARTEAQDRSYEAVETGLSAAQADAVAAESAYEAATEAGNFKEAAKAQRRMAQAEVRIQRFEEAKADFEARRTADPRQEARLQPKNQTEAWIDSRTPPSRDWIRAHREWVDDPHKAHLLSAAHSKAMYDRIQIDTPEYFEHIERFLGIREQTQPETPTNGAAKPAIPTKRPSAPPAAPVSGSGGGMTSSGGGRTVTLSKTEAAAATDGTLVWNYDDPSGNKKFKKGDPIGVQEFARRKLALQQQGAYDRSYTEQ